MRTHLGRKALEPDALELAIETLKQQGYLDDVRFAQLFVEDKRTLTLWGSERIRRTLLARGIDRELAEEALREDGERGTQVDLERALELLRRRFPAPPRERRERERALGVLLRKGYDSELALEALARYPRQP